MAIPAARRAAPKKKEGGNRKIEAALPALPARGRSPAGTGHLAVVNRRTAARGIPCISSRRAAVAETPSATSTATHPIHIHSHSCPPPQRLSSLHPLSSTPSTHDTPPPPAACFQNTVKTPRHIYIYSPGTPPARPLPSTPFLAGCSRLRHPIYPPICTSKKADTSPEPSPPEPPPSLLLLQCRPTLSTPTRAPSSSLPMRPTSSSPRPTSPRSSTRSPSYMASPEKPPSAQGSEQSTKRTRSLAPPHPLCPNHPPPSNYPNHPPPPLLPYTPYYPY